VVDQVALGQVSSEYFGFSLSISFHRCSITRKNTPCLYGFITHSLSKKINSSLAVLYHLSIFLLLLRPTQILSNPKDFDKVIIFFSPMSRQPLGSLGRLIFRGFMITHFRHTTLGRTPLDEGPAHRREGKYIYFRM
jgi:hypothetical protein